MDLLFITEKCVKFETRAQNLYPKLFFGMQDHVVAPEFRQCAVNLRKCGEAGDFPAALENARKISYFLDVIHENRMITDPVYESIKTDIEEIVAMLSEDGAACEAEPACPAQQE